MGIAWVKSDNYTVKLPTPALTAINIGDLSWWDYTNLIANSAANRVDQGSLAANQRDLAKLFVGVAWDMRLATETETGIQSYRLYVTDGIFDCPCAPAAFEVGTYVGVDRNIATPANYNQQVIAVTDPALAIGIVAERTLLIAPTVTTVRCRLVSRLYSSLERMISLSMGMQGIGATVVADASATLVPSFTPMLSMAPTAARNLTMPLEALCNGMEVLFTNNSANGSMVTFLGSAGGPAKGNSVVPAGKCARLWCDGTNWNCLVSN